MSIQWGQQTAGVELCSPLPEGHRAKWLTHIIPFRSHKSTEAVLPPFSQRRKPVLICGCKSRRAGPSPRHTSACYPSPRPSSVKVAPAHYKCHHVPVCLHGKWLSKVTSSYPPIFQARSRRLEGLLITPGSAAVKARPVARSPSAQRRHAPCLLGPSMLCVCWVQA